MKKLIIILITACILVPVSLFSQNKTKFGHVSPEEIMKLIPGFDTAQKAMLDYQTNYQNEGQEMVKEFQLKQQDYEKLLSTNTSPAILKIKEDELTAMYKRIEEFSSELDANLQSKKVELLMPFQNLIMDAIKEIAKAENFSYIFNKSVLSYYEQGEDISEKVKLKLGIPK
jgi:outer membrane protein